MFHQREEKKKNKNKYFNFFSSSGDGGGGLKKIIRLESCLPDEVDVLASEPESSFWLCYSLLYRPEGGKSGVGWVGGGIGLNFHFF